MIRHEKPKLTAAEVKKLPVESKVELHGRDRFGYPTILECTVAQSGKKKVLIYRDANLMRGVKQIKDYPNKYYTEGLL